MRRLLSIGWLFIGVVLMNVTLVSAQTPPVAPVRNIIDGYWGVKVSDPYRYMEDLKGPEVQAWIKGQAEYSESVITPNHYIIDSAYTMPRSRGLELRPV